MGLDYCLKLYLALCRVYIISLVCLYTFTIKSQILKCIEKSLCLIVIRKLYPVLDYISSLLKNKVTVLLVYIYYKKVISIETEALVVLGLERSLYD